MSRLSLNTHDYDGKLKHEHPTSFSPTEFQQTLQDIRTDIQTNAQTILSAHINLSAIHIAINLIERDKRGNFDHTNNLHAEHVLIVAWQNVKTFDLDGRLIFFEQLADITTQGSCSQGRTTRLMQFYK